MVTSVVIITSVLVVTVTVFRVVTVLLAFVPYSPKPAAAATIKITTTTLKIVFDTADLAFGEDEGEGEEEEETGSFMKQCNYKFLYLGRFRSVVNFYCKILPNLFKKNSPESES